MIVTVSIPIKRHLKKFFYWKQELEYGTEINLGVTSEMNIIIKGLLGGKVNLQERKWPEVGEIYNDQLFCIVDRDHFNRGYLFLNHRIIRFFNFLLQQQFNETLYHRIKMAKEYNLKEQEIIYSFMSELQLEEDEDITFDALKKAAYRMKVKKNT
jgi:hypothetical protein